MPLQGIVFDLDGTLIDQDGAERDALRNFYDHELAQATKPPYHVFLRDWRNDADEYLQRFLDKQMGFEEQRVARIKALYARCGFACPPAEAKRLSRAYANAYSAQWRVFGDTLPALRSLSKRHRLAVITNGDGAQQRAKLVATGLSPFFEHVLVSGDVPVRKPDPAIFDLCARALKLASETLAYVGDRLDVDVAGAKAAGWRAVWLDRKGMPRTGEQAGLLVVGSLTDLDSSLESE